MLIECFKFQKPFISYQRKLWASIISLSWSETKCVHFYGTESITRLNMYQTTTLPTKQICALCEDFSDKFLFLLWPVKYKEMQESESRNCYVCLNWWTNDQGDAQIQIVSDDRITMIEYFEGNVDLSWMPSKLNLFKMTKANNFMHCNAMNFSWCNIISLFRAKVALLFISSTTNAKFTVHTVYAVHDKIELEAKVTLIMSDFLEKMSNDDLAVVYCSEYRRTKATKFHATLPLHRFVCVFALN